MAVNKKLLEHAQKIVDSTSINEQMGMLADHGIAIARDYLELAGIKQAAKKSKK